MDAPAASCVTFTGNNKGIASAVVALEYASLGLLVAFAIALARLLSLGRVVPPASALEFIADHDADHDAQDRLDAENFYRVQPPTARAAARGMINGSGGSNAAADVHGVLARVRAAISDAAALLRIQIAQSGIKKVAQTLPWSRSAPTTPKSPVPLPSGSQPAEVNPGEGAVDADGDAHPAFDGSNVQEEDEADHEMPKSFEALAQHV